MSGSGARDQIVAKVPDLHYRRGCTGKTTKPRAAPRLHSTIFEASWDCPSGGSAGCSDSIGPPPRRIPTGPDDEERLTADLVELAAGTARLGYRKIAEIWRSTAGWIVNDKRVEARSQRGWLGAGG